MRSYTLLLLCCLAVGGLAASAGRMVRDAEDDSEEEEYQPAQFRSSALVDITDKRSSRGIDLGPIRTIGKIIKIAKVALLVLVATGVIPRDNMSLPVDLQTLQNIPTLVADVSEFLVELPGYLQIGSRQEVIAREANLALGDLNTLDILDEGAVTAVAKLQGEAKGELSLAQARHNSGGTDDVTIVSGTLSGLKPGVHKLQVTLKGDISDRCAYVGDAYSSDSDGIFIANEAGKALVVVRLGKAPLRGTDTILGRSLVITSEDTGDQVCGVIVHPSS